MQGQESHELATSSVYGKVRVDEGLHPIEGVVIAVVVVDGISVATPESEVQLQVKLSVLFLHSIKNKQLDA